MTRLERLIRDVSDERARTAERVLTGSCKSYEHYREQCGVIRALDVVIDRAQGDSGEVEEFEPLDLES